MGPHLLPYMEEDSQGIDIGQTRTTWAYRVTSTWPSKNTKIVLYETGAPEVEKGSGQSKKIGGKGLKTTKKVTIFGSEEGAIAHGSAKHTF